MLRVGSRTTITKNQNLVASFERGNYSLGNINKLTQIFINESLLNTDTFFEYFYYMIFHTYPPIILLKYPTQKRG